MLIAANPLSRPEWESRRRDPHAAYPPRQQRAHRRCTGRAQGQGFCLNNLGDTYRLLGRPARAIEYLERALLVQHGTRDQAGLQFTLSTLGDLHRDAGRTGEALSHYRAALATSRMLADQRTTARALANIAETLTARGETGEARTRWRQALTIFDELGDAQASTIRARLGEPR